MRRSIEVLLLACFVFVASTGLAFGQDDQEPLPDISVRLPWPMLIGYQEFTGGGSLAAIALSVSFRPIHVGDAYDEEGLAKSQIRVQHLEGAIDAVAPDFASDAARIFSLRYAITNAQNQTRGFGLYSKAAAGPGLYVNGDVIALTASGSIGYGIGYDFRQVGIGLFGQGTTGLYFIGGNTSLYFGGGFGIYFSYLAEIDPGIVDDVPNDQE